MDHFNPQQRNKQKLLLFFVKIMHIKGLCGSALHLKDPQRAALFELPQGLLRLPHSTQDLPGLFPLHHQLPNTNSHLLRGASASISSGRQRPSPWQAPTGIFLNGRWRQFSQWSLAPISSEGCWHPSPQRDTGINFFQQGSTHHFSRYLRYLLSVPLAAISSVWH